MTAGTWIKTAIGCSGLWLCVQGTPAWGSPASPTQTGAVSVQPAATQDEASQPSNSNQERADFAQTYQQREQAAAAQKNFEGGGAGLYIGGSTAAIVLLLVILIVVL